MKKKTLALMVLSCGLGLTLTGCFDTVEPNVQIKSQPVALNIEAETFEVVELSNEVLCARYAAEHGLTEGGDHNEGSEFIKQDDGTYKVERFMEDGFTNGAEFKPAICTVTNGVAILTVQR